MIGRVENPTLGPVESATQARILRLLRDLGATSRVDLSEHVGASRTTIAAEVARLAELGYLRDAGAAESRGGRRSRMVALPDDLAFVGVDIGSTSIDVALTNAQLEVLAQVSEDCDIRQGPQAVLSRVRELASKLRTDNPEQRPVALGVGVPGPVDFDRGRPVSPPIMPGWDRYPVRDALSSALGLPAVLDNDVNLMAMGELHAGVARNLDSFLFVKIGTGIGCGIVVHGELYRGVDGCAGDIGHIRADATGPVCACGNIGCLEAFFGGAALARDGRAAADSGRSAILAQLLAEDGTITAVHVARAAAAGDPVSTALVRSGGQRLGSVLAGLVSFFNPSMVVIGGEVSRIGHELLGEVRSVVYQRSLPLATENMPIVHSEMEGQGGVVGAARLASDLVFSDTRR
jgi:glucokinase-like ROK family protein